MLTAATAASVGVRVVLLLLLLMLTTTPDVVGVIFPLAVVVVVLVKLLLFEATLGNAPPPPVAFLFVGDPPTIIRLHLFAIFFKHNSPRREFEKMRD